MPLTIIISSSSLNITRSRTVFVVPCSEGNAPCGSRFQRGHCPICAIFVTAKRKRQEALDARTGAGGRGRKMAEPGTKSGDLINGSAIAETINGKEGNDSLNGGGGNDLINGGIGND